METTYTYLDKRRDDKLQFLKRNSNGKIYIRFRLPNLKRYIYKSTQTKDLRDGYRIGLDMYDEMKWKSKNNINVFDQDFKHFWNEWFDYREKQGGSEGRIKFIESTGRLYLLPYFGKSKSTEINDRFVEKYWVWRQRYWIDGYGKKELDKVRKSRSRGTKKDPYKKYKNLKYNVSENPSDNTLRMEQSLIKEVFRWMNRNGYLSTVPLVKRPNFGRPISNNRPNFEDKEWDQLHRYLNEWCDESLGEKSRITITHRNQRNLLKNFVMILRNTGLRTGELSQMRWCDYELVNEENKEEPYLRIYVRETTKTRKSRNIVCRPHTLRYFDRIRELSEYTKQNDFIFCDKKGEPRNNFGKTFKEILKTTGLLENREGKVRTLYSLRHQYINDRLLRGTPIDIVAKNCGTSINHIQNTYRHDTVSIHSDQLLKKLPKRRNQ
jgi:integrase